MAEPRIRFAKLREFLFELGFTEVVVPDSHIGFRHELSDTTIMLPTYRSNETVHSHHLVPIRTLLDAKGLLDGDEFDRMVGTGSASRSAS